MSELKTYEMKIGYSRQPSNGKGKREDIPVRTEYIEAKSLKSAKSIATNKLKDCEDMKGFLKRKNGEDMKWSAWTKTKSRGTDFYSYKKSEIIRKDDHDIFGFVQILWDESQMNFDFKDRI